MSSVGDTEVKLVGEYIKRTKKWVFGFLRHGLRKQAKNEIHPMN